MLALTLYEAHVHQACGYHASAIDNPDDHPLVPDRFECPFCAAHERQARIWELEDRQLQKRIGKPEPGRPYPTDGVSRFLRPATPDEIAQHQVETREGGDRG